MGFQFNQVGGGTKTRRPIALRMQYNPRCSSPMCFLTLENGKEEPRTLQDIQVLRGLCCCGGRNRLAMLISTFVFF